jgi:hypothetical protein
MTGRETPKACPFSAALEAPVTTQILPSEYEFFAAAFKRKAHVLFLSPVPLARREGQDEG